MTIPFTKAHGAKNDFLLSWAEDSPASDSQLSEVAMRICDRHTGVGADGWLVVAKGSDVYHGSIRLFNPDGSEPEISGNGTRCAGAFLIAAGLATDEVSILTGAGPKTMRVLERNGNLFLFEMNMGRPLIEDANYRFESHEGTILNVGNPQCALFVDNFDLDWEKVGAQVEAHPHFPNRTNVSFVKVVDEHTVDVRFFERGVGVTMSSGTGSTGAAAAAIARGTVKSPVKIMTPAGRLDLTWDGQDALLTGPAEIIAKGEFFL